MSSINMLTAYPLRCISEQPLPYIQSSVKISIVLLHLVHTDKADNGDNSQVLSFSSNLHAQAMKSK